MKKPRKIVSPGRKKTTMKCGQATAFPNFRSEIRMSCISDKSARKVLFPAAVKTERAVGRRNGRDGMLVQQDIPLAFDKKAKIIKGLDIAFEPFSGHHDNNDVNSLFTSLI
jgi:hypothetical protein